MSDTRPDVASSLRVITNHAVLTLDITHLGGYFFRTKHTRSVQVNSFQGLTDIMQGNSREMWVASSKEFFKEVVLLERLQIPRLSAEVAGMEYGA